MKIRTTAIPVGLLVAATACSGVLGIKDDTRLVQCNTDNDCSGAKCKDHRCETSGGATGNAGGTQSSGGIFNSNGGAAGGVGTGGTEGGATASNTAAGGSGTGQTGGAGGSGTGQTGGAAGSSTVQTGGAGGSSQPQTGGAAGSVGAGGTEGGATASNTAAGGSGTGQTGGAGGSCGPLEVGGAGGFSSPQTGGTAGTGGAGGTEGGATASNTGGSANQVGGTGSTLGGTTGSDRDASSGGDTSTDCSGTATPIIATPTELPGGCSSEVYNVELTATGGTASELEWSLASPSETLPLDLGLNLTGNRLTGVLGKAVDSYYEFYVAVRNKATGCASLPKRFIIKVSGDTAPNCPAIRVVGSYWRSTPVPPYCRGWPYDVQLEVFNPGSGKYTWETIAFPSELHFDSMTQKITGTPTNGGPITMQLEDDTGRRFRKTYDVPMRDSCWLAYLDGDTGAARLNLVDPYLRHSLQRPEPSDASGMTVVDFQFSPDGKFLVYRVKDASNIQRLWIWQGPLWDHEQPLDFDDGSSVSYYAWSSNSHVLAVEYTASNGNPMLGGVDVSSVPAASTGAGVQKMIRLGAVVALANPDLTWYAEDTQLAFSSPVVPDEPKGDQMVSYTKLGDSGFSPPVSPGVAPYSYPIILYSGSLGFFATNESNSVLFFYDPHQYVHGIEAIAPNGDYTASASGETLKVFPASARTTESKPVPYASVTGCAQLLAWGGQPERIVCMSRIDTAVHAHTLNAADLDDAVVEGSQGFSDQSWAGHSRLISPIGNRLALATDDHLHMLSLGQAAPSVVWSMTFVDRVRSTGLSFSPDGTALVLQRGQDLDLYDVSSKDLNVYIGDSSDLVQHCQENLLSIPSWCGRNNVSAQAIWSSDSGLVAFHTYTGEIHIQDVRIRLERVLEDPIDIHCVGGCIDGFRFQP